MLFLDVVAEPLIKQSSTIAIGIVFLVIAIILLGVGVVFLIKFLKDRNKK